MQNKIKYSEWNVAKINEKVQQETGIEWCVMGFKKNDSLNRRLMLNTYPDEMTSEKGKKLYPLSNWNNKQVLAYIQKERLIQPISYGQANAISSKIILAGTPGHTTILAVQNVIIPTGLFAAFADKTHEILTEATIDGPIPAITDLQTEGNKIIAGTPTWPQGLGIDKCQKIINDSGLNSFLLENQHDVHQTDGALWTRKKIHYSDLPEKIDEYNIGRDPAMSDGPRSDLSAIYISALSGNDIYIIDGISGRWHPSITKQKLLDFYWKYQCEVHIEIDNGGQWLVDALIEAGIPKSRVIGEKSGGVSKRGRAQPFADKSSETLPDKLCQVNSIFLGAVNLLKLSQE